MLENLDLSGIQEENARKLVKILLNQIEELSASLRELRVENQQLRDESNRLKGEQGKPNVKANVGQPAASQHSSEKERHKKRSHHQAKRYPAVGRIDRNLRPKTQPRLVLFFCLTPNPDKPEKIWVRFIWVRNVQT